MKVIEESRQARIEATENRKKNFFSHLFSSKKDQGANP